MGHGHHHPLGKVGGEVRKGIWEQKKQMISTMPKRASATVISLRGRAMVSEGMGSRRIFTLLLP
jgi:hypothetical protein